MHASLLWSLKINRESLVLHVLDARLLYVSTHAF